MIGVVVAAVIVLVVAFCEELLPRLRQLSRMESALREEMRGFEAQPEAVAVSPKGGSRLSGTSRTGSAPLRVAEASVSDRRAKRRAPVRPDASDRREKPAPPVGEEVTSVAQDPTALWEDARAMKHSFVPDLKKDADYLKKMSQAAKLGNVDAMMKLSAYAQRRLKFVESFYWAQMAHQAGCAAAAAEQRKILVQWRARGCPGEHNNVRPEFTETNGSFARAILRLRSGIDVLAARQRLKRLAEKGDMAAKSFLEQQKKTR